MMSPAGQRSVPSPSALLSTDLGLTFLGTLALSLWGANAGTKAIFDALNIIYKEREKRSFLQLTLRSLLFTVAGIVLALLAMARLSRSLQRLAEGS
jgi:uncharacterized BrkB/YihY/UPF0761 family membrane protein